MSSFVKCQELLITIIYGSSKNVVITSIAYCKLLSANSTSTYPNQTACTYNSNTVIYLSNLHCRCNVHCLHST